MKVLSKRSGKGNDGLSVSYLDKVCFSGTYRFYVDSKCVLNSKQHAEGEISLSWRISRDRYVASTEKSLAEKGEFCPFGTCHSYLTAERGLFVAEGNIFVLYQATTVYLWNKFLLFSLYRVFQSRHVDSKLDDSTWKSKWIKKYQFLVLIC